jgi:hypothetical protein
MDLEPEGRAGYRRPPLLQWARGRAGGGTARDQARSAASELSPASLASIGTGVQG